jgi:hypothetical protein
MKVSLNMMFLMQKALVEKFDVMLFKDGKMSPCTRVKCNKGNNWQPYLEAYAKIQVVVMI